MATALPHLWWKCVVEVMDQLYRMMRVLLLPRRLEQRRPGYQTHLNLADVTVVHCVRHLFIEGRINVKANAVLKLLVPLFRLLVLDWW